MRLPGIAPRSPGQAPLPASVSNYGDGRGRLRFTPLVEVLLVTGLIALIIGVPIFVAVQSGSVSVPHSDDWSYRRTALEFYNNGHLNYRGWTTMTLIGQLYLVLPFLWFAHGDAWAFAVSTAIVAAIGIVSSYLVVRLILKRNVFWPTLILVVFPGFVSSTTTFTCVIRRWR